MAKSNNRNYKKMVFFDLEYYVPKENRKKVVLSYNPWQIGNIFLGGVFYSFDSSVNLKKGTPLNQQNKISFWIWNYDNDECLLTIAIYNYLREIKEVVISENSGFAFPVLSGIGISHSDIPVLWELFKKYELISNETSFEFQNSFRTIDLSQISIGAFECSLPILYPKTKNELLKRFSLKTSSENSKSVWDYYESGATKFIEDRVLNEIEFSIEIYMAIKDVFVNSNEKEFRL